MNTLTKMAPMLERLFTLSDAARPVFSDVPGSERERLMRSKTEYLELYGALKEFPLAVSREAGALLYMLSRAIGAQTIVEFGTSFGVSTLHLAAAVRDNGGGRVITTEFEPSKAERALEHFVAGGVTDLIEIRLGDAMQTLASDLPETIDLVLLDGAKALYPEILAMLESRLRPGALIIADNADYAPDYLARVRSAEAGYLSVPFGDDVELSMKL
ncbi:O-methyltransferase [Caulobacter segnis]|uniref:O-methyltransferase family 3 n=2 Tax=Caulobacter segnis TaxID=88688 RepID=D5VE82_CAUST|nr:class I SAM-dependent methyltransferase [Caulobacter segnis]ADG08905.1 O-methyltransferase family 3 [Caulobacter segnis ATCC 21756]